VFFGPCTPDILTTHASVFPSRFNSLDKFAKLATSCIPTLLHVIGTVIYQSLTSISLSLSGCALFAA
jgi:hypothetical protein